MCGISEAKTSYLFYNICVCRLKQKVHSKLLDCFVAALELLSSPELVVKVTPENCFIPVTL